MHIDNLTQKWNESCIVLFFLLASRIRFLDSFGEMLLQMFWHTETPHFLGPKHLRHGVVRGEKLFVIWVLEVILLQVGP